MVAFIISRLIQSIPLVVGATIVIFAMMRLIPGDPAQVLAGPEASAEQVEQARKHLGLDRPLPIQYLTWVGNVVRGDLGDSYISRRPVTDLIKNRGPATLQLAGAALFLTVVIAIPLGILAAVRAGGIFDWIVTTVTGLAIGIPSFWAGLLLLLLFASYLGWLPAGGRGSWSEDPIDAFKHLLLPALVLASVTISTLTRLVRAAMLEALYEDYVRTARAKGLAEGRVVIKHVLRNALVPVITVIGLQVGNLLGGSVILEVVFAWPGVGRMIIDALSSRDYMVIQGALLVLVFVYIVINLITDITYGLVDPRIRVS